MNQYKQHEIKLAHEIAEALNDWGALQFHLSNARNYPESFLREQLDLVLNKDEKDIHTTRARYYTWLINNRGKKNGGARD